MDTGNLSQLVQLILLKKGFPLIGLRECKLDEDFSSFSKALSSTVDHNEHGPFVDKQTVNDLKDRGVRPFLARDGMAGVAVWPDKNIGAAFKDSRSLNKGAIGELMLTALSIGGNKLDCYGDFLPRTYTKFGFVPVARVKFDRELAPDNWKKKFGEPDVVFLMHCGDSVLDVARKMGTYPSYDLGRLPCFNTYEEAYQYRDARLIGML